MTDSLLPVDAGSPLPPKGPNDAFALNVTIMVLFFAAVFILHNCK